MIKSTFEQVAFLNSLPLNVLDESLKIFRENIFSLSGRKQIPHEIYQVLEKQLIKEEHGIVDDFESHSRINVHDHLVERKDQATLFEFSK